MFDDNKTIYALCSGNLPAGVAVVRVSGTNLLPMFGKLTDIENPEPRKMNFVSIPEIDDVLAVYFAAPNSWTGEDVIEIHSHGSRAVVDKIYAALENLGARLAQRGEFASRAFMNGKMDLQQVDGLADLINAKTERQRVQSFAAFTGAGSRLYNEWRDALVEISANLAAEIEFPDDELPAGLADDAQTKIKKLLTDIEKHIGTEAVGRKIKSGFRIVLAGEVNAGKSSLFNALLGTTRAIVSSAPGTTRDFISAELDIGGYLVELIDTAGLRDANDEVEKIGVDKARDIIESADLVISVINPVGNAAPVSDFVVRTHADINPKGEISVKTGQGMDALIARIKKEIESSLNLSAPAAVSNDMTAGLLREAADFLRRALTENIQEFRSENARLAAASLGKVLGVVDFAEIQSAIFGRLCLGK
ncbi:MAG: tRNA uridine-5-carboxymethylaminomethyl(34) synthesis GTPase MnmE [Rickettsiales bacterium]|jgi:tRNA modification GTPase|nr:tRNA uridine-5-carboxymethylaminomethyl(34) synthesis GTPase MnmE [Rickettsiales bacterium]